MKVVERIKLVSNETKLLVVDSQTDAFYRERNVVVCGTMDSVVKLTNPPPEASPEASPVQVS